MRLDKIYTRSGDKGSTYLIGGSKVSKSDIQVECYGTVDELNSSIGVIRTIALELKDCEEVSAGSEEWFRKIQNDLFDIGSILATARNDNQDSDLAKKIIASYSDETKEHETARVVYLETKIDLMNETLGSLDSFTLPGGCQLNAFSHVARTICRRLERLMVLWECRSEQELQLLAYVNRLSDLLFVYSRWVSKLLNADEFLWDTPLKGK
ncbi:MAG: ATP:cob(I)alamin adenosyltransferase [Planctomycetota bacterium]|nr:MAG: ATP:cob(I)alamin adenosyltransferase [Planctomycetota bacterium]